MSDLIPVTKTGYEKIKAELDHLESVEMPAVTERIATARAEGDLRENAEYHGARESQGMLQAKINLLRDTLSRAQIVDTSKLPKDEVCFGATVIVKDLEFGDEESFTLVGAGEEDYDTGKINVSSPLAQGLLGRKVGDKVEIPVPAGTMKFKLLEIKFEMYGIFSGISPMRIRGSHAFLRMLADAGVKYLFGNPGTSELPINDALFDEPRIKYILGLQEVPVMAMADGYAMASHSLGVVNLHISCGLGNAMGMLYNAFREGTPLLVTAGQQDRRLMFEEPILWGEMVRVVRPWTKWAVEVNRVEDLPSALRRAAQVALTPPTGPVFLSIPMDVQMMEGELELTPAAKLDHRVRPPREAIGRAADLLLSAKNPAILVGSRVCEADAVNELVALAERLGAPAISESGTTHGRLGFPADHRLSAANLPLWSPEIRDRLQEFDVLFVTGMDLLRLYVYFEPSRAIPEHIRIIHLDEDPYQLGKNYPLEVGLLGDTKAGLQELVEELAKRQTTSQAAVAKQRTAKYAAEHERDRAALLRQAQAERSERPLTPLCLMESLARILPPNVAVIEEAVTTTNRTFERLAALKNTSGYFGHRGWALGWGLGCAIGVKLAWPERPVLAMLGEGSATYGIQGLWSAAKYNLPVTFVICNNAQYKILKVGANNLALPHAADGRYVGIDLTEPEIDYVGLARSFQIEAQTVTEPEELTELVRGSLAGDRPRLFNVPISRDTPERLDY